MHYVRAGVLMYVGVQSYDIHVVFGLLSTKGVQNKNNFNIVFPVPYGRWQNETPQGAEWDTGILKV